MDSQTVDILYRSRKTLLEILKSRGYNTIPYEKFGPWEVEEMASTGATAMRMDLASSIEGDPKRCRVLYGFNKLKLGVARFIHTNFLNEESDDTIDVANTEAIVITLEPIAEAFHTAALAAWTNSGLKIAFFNAESLVNDPRKHIDVPLHERISPAEEADIRKRFHIKSKSTLPIIPFHRDIQARILFLMPLEICRITRGSPTAGEYVSYRVCAP
jgi:DNA-directed RNA polymerase subunit H (RpoH/RPB5)